MKLRVEANLFILLGFISFAITGFNNQTRAFTSANSYQIIPVATAISDQNTDFIPDKLGDTVSVAGRVTISSGVLWKDRLQIALQDYTGGIAIYERDYQGPRITMGDSLQLTGIISQYRGQTQLTNIYVNFIDSLNRKVPLPVHLVNSHPETYEGRLVTINGRIINISSNAGGDYLIVSHTTGSDSTLMVFNSKNHKYPDLLKNFTIGESLKITGLFAHYTNNKNANRNYQLLPRSPEDLEVVEYSARFYIYSVAGIAVIAFFVLFFNVVLSRRVRQKTKNLKESEEALRNANQKMNAFFEQSLDGFFFMMLDEPIEWTEGADKELLLDFAFSNQRITKINDAMLYQYGATRDQFVGMTPNEMFGHNIDHGKNEWRKLFDLGKLHTETEERKMNGEILFIEGDYTCLYDSDGRITGHFGIQRDITDSRKMAEKLRESEGKYRYLFENNPAPMWIYDLETLRFLEVNNTAIIQYGYSREEFLCMTLKNIRPEEDIEVLLKDVEQTTDPFNKAGIWRHIKKNGDIIFVEITSHQLEFQDRPARMVLINDVSERKKAQDALVESENSLKQAQIIANMGDWEFDLINNKSKWSENCYRLYDLQPYEITPNYDYFRSRVHPDDLHLIDEGFTTLLQTKAPVEQEIRIIFSDNRIIGIGA